MGNKNVRLYDYIDINIQTIQRLFIEYDPNVKVEKLQLIPEGASTTNYIVYIKNSLKKYVLKIYPENGGNSLVEVSAYLYAKNFVNVPYIYYFDDSKKIYPRPYLIMDYIDGISLNKFVSVKGEFSEKVAHKVGGKLALLHSHQYENMGLLNEKLEIQKVLLPVSTLHEHYFNGISGKFISKETKNNVLQFISQNNELLTLLEKKFVFSHGDFGPSNILIDGNDDIWFIDFEYCLSAPIYYDIGKFFRDRSEMDKYMKKSIYDSFANGYNTFAKNPVFEDWIKIAKLMDMTSLLALLNNEKVAESWSRAIEVDINRTMRVLKNIDLF